MGSDDVRARAEAWAASEVDAYPGGTLDERIRSWMHGGVHPDDVARFVVDGYEAGHRAALAVAPATAQPGAKPAAWAIRHDREDDPDDWAIYEDRAEAESSVTSAFFGPGYRVVPLYAAPPATGDAAAVGIAGLDFHVPRDRTPSGYTRVEAYMGNGHVVVMGSPIDESHSCDALGCGSTGAHVIARLPLPAPANAVEEARAKLMESVRVLCVKREEGVSALALGGYVDLVWDAYAAYLRAAATHAAKESRSDDRPAKGQGGV